MRYRKRLLWLALGSRFLPLLARRNGNGHILHVDAGDAMRNAKNPEYAQVEGEFFDVEHGREVAAIVIAERKALADDAHRGRDIDVETFELHIAVEALAQLADDPLADSIIGIASTRENKEGQTSDEECKDSDGVGPDTTTGFGWQQSLLKEL
jgi:hypothetical protein